MKHANNFTCMLQTHFSKLSNSGSYNDELKKILKLNDFPEVKFPNNPPSTKIIAAITSAEKNTRRHRPKHNTNCRKNMKHKKKQQQQKVPTSDWKCTLPETMESHEQNLQKQTFVKGLQENKYRFTYFEEVLEEEEIINMINRNSRDVTDCFSIIEDRKFNKTRTGRTRQRTPSTVPQKRAVSRKNSL